MKLAKGDIWTNNAIDFGREVRREVVTSLIGDGIFPQDGGAVEAFLCSLAATALPKTL